MSCIYHRAISPFLAPDLLYKLLGPRDWKPTLKILHDFTDAVILERQSHVKTDHVSSRRTPSESAPRRKAFLDLLLSATTEDGRSLDNASIREEVDTFMFEGLFSSLS